MRESALPNSANPFAVRMHMRRFRKQERRQELDGGHKEARVLFYDSPFGDFDVWNKMLALHGYNNIFRGDGLLQYK